MKKRKKSPGDRTITIITHSEEETMQLARKLAKNFRGLEVVLLIGELGAGKTIFAKGIVAGLGLENSDQVCSPCFTILNIYQARFPVFHFDLYRLEREADILDLGWEDYLDRGVIIVEWGERMPFDVAAIRVTILREKNDERRIEIELPWAADQERKKLVKT